MNNLNIITVDYSSSASIDRVGSLKKDGLEEQKNISSHHEAVNSERESFESELQQAVELQSALVDDQEVAVAHDDDEKSAVNVLLPVFLAASEEESLILIVDNEISVEERSLVEVGLKKQPEILREKSSSTQVLEHTFQVERGVQAYVGQQEQRVVASSAKELFMQIMQENVKIDEIQSSLDANNLTTQSSKELLLSNTSELRMDRQHIKDVLPVKQANLAQNLSFDQQDSVNNMVLIVNNLKAEAPSNSIESMKIRSDTATAVHNMMMESGNAEIVKRAQFVLRAEQNSEIRLTLRPEHLGTVRVQLNVEDGRVLGRIIVANAAVKEAFSDNMSDLRDAFLKSGFDSNFDLNYQGEQHEQKENEAHKYYSKRLQHDDEATGAGDILAYWQQNERGTL